MAGGILYSKLIQQSQIHTNASYQKVYLYFQIGASGAPAAVSQVDPVYQQREIRIPKEREEQVSLYKIRMAVAKYFKLKLTSILELFLTSVSVKEQEKDFTSELLIHQYSSQVQICLYKLLCYIIISG